MVVSPDVSCTETSNSCSLTDTIDNVHYQLHLRISSKNYTFHDLYSVGRYGFSDISNIISDHARTPSGIFLETFIHYSIISNNVKNFSEIFLALIKHKTFIIEDQLRSVRYVNTLKYIPVFNVSCTKYPFCENQSFISLKDLVDKSLSLDKRIRRRTKFLEYLVGSTDGVAAYNFANKVSDITRTIASIFSLGEDSIFIITPTKKERLNNSSCNIHIGYKFLPGFSDKQLCIDLGAKKTLI